MKKKIFTLVALAAVALAGSAQETLYLIKGDKLVAKFPVADVDYATFKLPDGVTDNTGDNTLERKSYVSAAAAYLGTEAECGHFQIQLSTRGITEENPPLDFLYLQISTPKVTDLKNIKVAPGTYSLGDAEAIAPYKFYPGIHTEVDGNPAGAGTLVVLRPDAVTTEYIAVNDGTFTISQETEGQYIVSGLLKQENGNVLEFSYSGPLVVTNNSDEKPDADDIPLDPSDLTADYTVTPLASDSYVTVYNGLFSDVPDMQYVMFSFYEDNEYANCADVAVVVNRKKYPDVLLPKGTYTVFKRNGTVDLASLDYAACPAFKVMGDGVIGTYGCWLTLGYTEKAPLVAGTVEILEDVTTWNEVKLKFNLQDNAETPHTVSGEFSGSVTPL